MGLTKARLLKHDLPVHGKLPQILISLISVFWSFVIVIAAWGLFQPCLVSIPGRRPEI